MTVALYMNHNVPMAITEGLRLRDVDVLTAYEDKSHQLADPLLLDRAGDLRRVMFSMDSDLIAEATRRQRTEGKFPGVVYAHQERCSIGRCIADLELIAKALEPDDLQSRVFYLPL